MLKMKGALRRPKGSTRSKKYKSRHSMPRSSQSSGCTGMLRKADLTSVLATKHFGPRFRRILIASSRRTYCSEYSSGEMFALTLALELFGYDKWKIVLHLDEFFLGTRPKGKFENFEMGVK